jgi:hypothetical protein
MRESLVRWLTPLSTCAWCANVRPWSARMSSYVVTTVPFGVVRSRRTYCQALPSTYSFDPKPRASTVAIRYPSTGVLIADTVVVNRSGTA